MHSQVKNQNTVLIGITGSFGSGKSTVGQILERYSVLVIDTDEIVRNILSSKNKITDKVALLFGGSVVAVEESGCLDRKKIAAVIFTDKIKKKQLEDLLHPEVLRISKRIIEESCNKFSFIAVLVPLLFEAKWKEMFDEIWCVVCNDDIRLDRLIRKGFSENDVKLRLESQLPQDIKAEKSDFVINNSGSISETEKQIKEQLKLLAQLNRNLRLSFDI